MPSVVDGRSHQLSSMDGNVIATAVNTVAATGDPIATLIVSEAIRRRREGAQVRPARRLAILYASVHPCPMCLAAMYVSGIQQGFYADSIEDAPAALSRAQ